MAGQTPLHFVFYFAAPAEKVWEGFVSPESNRTIFGGAGFSADLKPGGLLQWVGPGPNGERTVYVHGEVIKIEPPKRALRTTTTADSGAGGGPGC